MFYNTKSTAKNVLQNFSILQNWLILKKHKNGHKD